jgi:ELWxxDGT repeat protein
MVHKFKHSENYSGEATPTAFKGKLYYAINKYLKGNELWSTDGTTYATSMVKDIKPGSGSGLSRSVLFIYKDKLYFEATDSTLSRDIYTTDGTDTGTKKITLLVNPNQTLWIKNVIPFKDRLIFWAYDSNNTGSGIFVTDLTPSGTTKLIPPNATNSNPLSGALGKSFVFFEPDSAVYFPATYTYNSEELWSVREVNTTTIAAIPHTADITLYPNPAHHNFTIKTTTAFKAGSVTLTDVTGRIIKTEKLYNNEQTISLQGIAPGIYMADVWLDDKRSTQKIVVE